MSRTLKPGKDATLWNGSVPMDPGYSTLGFLVIVILYAVIGFMAAAGAISITRKSSSPKQSRSSMRCSSS